MFSQDAKKQISGGARPGKQISRLQSHLSFLRRDVCVFFPTAKHTEMHTSSTSSRCKLDKARVMLANVPPGQKRGKPWSIVTALQIQVWDEHAWTNLVHTSECGTGVVHITRRETNVVQTIQCMQSACLSLTWICSAFPFTNKLPSTCLTCGLHSMSAGTSQVAGSCCVFCQGGTLSTRRSTSSISQLKHTRPLLPPPLPASEPVRASNPP